MVEVKISGRFRRRIIRSRTKRGLFYGLIKKRKRRCKRKK
jgi:hypothetical protein